MHQTGRRGAGHAAAGARRSLWDALMSVTRQMRGLSPRTILALLCLAGVPTTAQDSPPRAAVPKDPDAASSKGPAAKLLTAPRARFTGDVDSSSPALWEVIEGRRTLVVMTSVAGRPSRASGASLRELSPATPVDIVPWPGEGVWMESVVSADDGTWYGFYHNERVATPCSATTRVAPRIGAARSSDFGMSWSDLGILIEAPPPTFDCGTFNTYFVGGVGDLSAMLDAESKYLYLYFSQYGADVTNQGIGAARLAWADRDAPVGKTDVWSGGQWVPAGRPRRSHWPQLLSGVDETSMRWVLSAATPLFATANPWHDGDREVDAFWGPSIHWNSHLECYVMLLNKAQDETFASEGIYVSFNATLANPAGWSEPVRILQGGRWYPQVLGVEADGTDTRAGRVARFFLSGQSDHVIQFDR